MTPCAAAIAAVLNALPGAQSEHVPTIAEAIAAAAPTPQRAALLLAIGYRESRFLPRIQEGKCERHECDPLRVRRGVTIHLARSFWQLHRTRLVPDWHRLHGLDAPTVRLAAESADRILERGLRACGTAAGAAGYFACGRCDWPGGKSRGALVDRLRPKLEACSV